MASFSHNNFGGGIEEVHIHIVAWVAQTDLNFARVGPFKPWPSQTKGPREFVNIKNTKAPKIFGATHRLLIYFALPTHDLVGS
jgi:hypothetical protein